MDAVKQYQDEVRVRRALAVMDYQVTHGVSIQDACNACNVAERTFYRWLNEGVLVDHLAGCQEGREKMVRARALYAVEEIVGYMVEIASGAKVVRGANPIAEAKFVYKVAGFEAGTSPTTYSQTNVLMGLPEMVRFEIVDANPVLDDQGRLEIIDGELEEPAD